MLLFFYFWTFQNIFNLSRNVFFLMNQFDLQVAKLPMIYRGRIARVLNQSEKMVLSQAGVAFYVSGILLHLHKPEDIITTTIEKKPEYLSLAVRVKEAAIGDALKLVGRQSKLFFGVLVNEEGLVFYYKEEGQERGCKMEGLRSLGEQFKPLDIRIYRRKSVSC